MVRRLALPPRESVSQVQNRSGVRPMSNRQFQNRSAFPPFVVGLALILATLGLAPEARAQQSAAVQALRRALAESLPITDVPEELAKALQERAKTLQQLTDDKSQLQSLGDIEEALLLPNWAEERSSAVGGPEAGKVDREARMALVQRFIQMLRGEIKAAEKEPDIRAAAATLIGEYAVSARSGYLSDQKIASLLIENMPRYTELVAELAESDPSPEVRVAAAGALAKLQSDPVKENTPRNDDLVMPVKYPITVPALNSMLKDANPAVRRAAAAALGDLLRGTRRADRGAYVASPVVEPAPENIFEFGPQVARSAGGILNGKETDPDVRRLAASALLQVATTLNTRLRPSDPSGGTVRQVLRPVINALWDQQSALDRATRDSDTRVRHTGLRAIEEMGDVRTNWASPEPIRTLPPIDKPKGGTKPPRLGYLESREETSDLTLTVALAQAPPEKPKGEPYALAESIPALASRLQDDNVRNRLAAIDALEAIAARPDEQRGQTTLAQDLGPKPTATAAKALTRALSDPDRFVRWAASRTLGEMAPLNDAENGASVERGAVGGLNRLLSDADPDVRMRAAIALERFGKAARDAVPGLAVAATNHRDLEARISAAHAISVIGGHAAEAVPALADALEDPNVRLRRTAAEALGSYGADAIGAKRTLNRALFDSDPEVRRLASDALLKIGAKR
jgi:HEAT repeat protein